MSDAYAIRIADGIFSHGYQAQLRFLHDLADSPEALAIQALVASGDCFEMLASNLDQISRTLPIDDSHQVELEQLIRTLLFMQNHYKIIKRPTDRDQNPGI